MTFGMPQSEQILYKALIKHVSPGADRPAATQVNFQGPAEHYSVDFAVDLNDLKLKLAPDGLHKGKLNLLSSSTIAMDKSPAEPITWLT